LLGWTAEGGRPHTFCWRFGLRGSQIGKSLSRSLKAHLLLVMITLIWGATFVVIKNALADISPLLFNAVRVSLAAVTLMVVFHRERGRVGRATLGYGALLGGLLWAGSELQTMGLEFTMPTKSAFLTGVAVVLVPVFLAIFWRRQVGMWSGAGVAMAFVGLYLLTVPAGASVGAMVAPGMRGAASLLLGLNFWGMNRGDLLTLAAAVVYAFHIIFMGHATRGHRWRQIAVLQTAVCAGLMVVSVFVGPAQRVVWSGPVIWGILITGFLSLALAFSIQAWAQQFTPATHTALIFSLEPVFAWLTSFVFLGERMGTRGAVGALLILGGVVISEEKGETESKAVAPDHAGVPQSELGSP
jgi:drug/metabolite transporter (DMT)-like permease